jgi:hypothetical protein
MAAAATPPTPSALAELGRSLLATPLETLAGEAASAARQAVSAASPPAPPVAGANGQAPAPAAAANGTAAQAVPPEPSELAWLVNEALIEQARRHGMDLS